MLEEASTASAAKNLFLSLRAFKHPVLRDESEIAIVGIRRMRNEKVQRDNYCKLFYREIHQTPI